ncbi:acyl carrier protein, partial [Streptomyces bambusae]
ARAAAPQAGPGSAEEPWRAPARPEPAAADRSAGATSDATSDAAADAAADPVLAAVVEAVTEVGGYEPERVVRAARFYEDLGFDSVMIMQLKDRLEARLPQASGITVPRLLPALRTVGTLAEFVGEWISVGATT